MLTQSVIAAALAIAASGAIGAQERPAPPQPRSAAPQPAPQPRQAPTPAPAPEAAPRIAREPEGQPVNIKLEITITDQGGAGEPSRKTVSMVMADRAAGSIRTFGNMTITTSGPQSTSINVDATPTVMRDGSIRLQLGLEYQPRPVTDPAQPDAAPPRMSQVNERLTVIVQDGKPLLVSQAADAGSERKVTVELKATVLK